MSNYPIPRIKITKRINTENIKNDRLKMAKYT